MTGEGGGWEGEELCNRGEGAEVEEEEEEGVVAVVLAVVAVVGAAAVIVRILTRVLVMPYGAAP